MQTHRVIPFGDGEYTFKLGMAQILAIEEKCGPIAAVRARVLAGIYSKDGEPILVGIEAKFGFHDVMEVCFQGLVGGKSGEVDGQLIEVDEYRAKHLVRTYLHPDAGNPMDKAWNIAAATLQALISGYEPALESAAAQKKSPRRKVTRGSSAGKSSATA